MLKNILGKTIMILSLFLLSANLLNAGFYNETYTDLYLDKNSWCAGAEVQFKIYNITDFENRRDIDAYLCNATSKCYENKCALPANEKKDICEPCEDCKYYNLVEKAKIRIYDGPLDSRPLLYEYTSPTGSFTYTFNKENSYLIEVISQEDKNGKKVQRYNDYQEIFQIMNCPGIEPIKVTSNKNFSYINSEIMLEIKNTTIEAQNEITVRNDINLPDATEENKKTITLSGPSGFQTLKLKIKYSVPTNKTKINLIEPITNKVTQISNYKYENGYLVIENAVYGTYAIIEENLVPEVIETPVINEEINSNDNSGSENNQNYVEEEFTNTNSNNDVKKVSLSSSAIKNIIYAVVGLGALILVIFGLSKIKRTPKQQVIVPEVLSTYEQAYQEAKRYVQKYKKDYLKDQIYRALEKGDVPRDIIDKVFKEEFK